MYFICIYFSIRIAERPAVIYVPSDDTSPATMAPLAKAKVGVPIWSDSQDQATEPFPSLLQGLDLFRLSKSTIASKIVIALNPPSTVYIATKADRLNDDLVDGGGIDVKDDGEDGNDNLRLTTGFVTTLFKMQVDSPSVTIDRELNKIVTILIDEGKTLFEFIFILGIDE